jgi:hypothetical protein
MQVQIVKGKYRGVEITNEVFSMISPLKPSNKGFEITVLAPTLNPTTQKIRIVVQDPNDVVYFAGSDNAPPAAVAKEVVPEETAEEAMSRIRKSFKVLETMTDAVAAGDVRSLIVSGPAGVGKSWGVEEVINTYEMQSLLGGKSLMSETVTGGISAIGLYKTLYENKDEGNVVIFDDCDAVLWDEQCLNLLKGALDSGKRRRISWKYESRVLAQEDIPRSFDFNGGVIFITNTNFESVRSKKLAPHLAALMSRSHYIDIGMYTDSDKFLRINQIVADGMLEKYHMSKSEEQELVDWMVLKSSSLRELSLRTVVKLADLRKMSPVDWMDIAETTLLRNPRAAA